MKRNTILIAILFIFRFNAYCAEPYSPEWVMYFQNYIENRQANQSVIFNALNLSDEQRKNFIDITQQDYDIYKNDFGELLIEITKLESLKNEQAPFSLIQNQKHIIKSYLKSIKYTSDQEYKDLKKILTRKQRSKYSMIKKLERHDLKKEFRPSDYYKKNPEMIPFGDLHLDCKSK